MMANLEQIIANKNASDTQWQHQQQAERENVTEIFNGEFLEHIARRVIFKLLTNSEFIDMLAAFLRK